MKNHKILFYFLLFIAGVFSLPRTSQAFMPEVYPIYGYNAQENICQIKQDAATAPKNEKFQGEYWNLRLCRQAHPQIIFNTGLGIVIWFSLFLWIFLFHYGLYPRLRAYTSIEKNLSVIMDIVFLGVVLFFFVLLQHFFDVPYVFYSYPSDFDHILYSTFIHGYVPIQFLILYLLIGFSRAGIMLLRKRRKK